MSKIKKTVYEVSRKMCYQVDSQSALESRHYTMKTFGEIISFIYALLVTLRNTEQRYQFDNRIYGSKSQLVDLDQTLYLEGIVCLNVMVPLQKRRCTFSGENVGETWGCTLED